MHGGGWRGARARREAPRRRPTPGPVRASPEKVLPPLDQTLPGVPTPDGAAVHFFAVTGNLDKTVPTMLFRFINEDPQCLQYPDTTYKSSEEPGNVCDKIRIDKGRVVYKTGLFTTYSSFAIRPSEAGKICPGDDLILGIDIMKKSTGKSLFRQATSGAKYLAVYDKKMLWRANLYINQSEDALGGKDWNDVYPWNAPPGDPAIASNIPIDGTGKKAVPAWWDRDWGYNEWNRTYDGTQSGDSLAALPVGNGKQVVTMGSFTPVRTIPEGNESAPTSANKINNAVAYSFPDHVGDGEAGGGDSGSMDSPFDYVWKLKKQKIALDSQSAVNANIPRVLAPSNKWNNYIKGNMNIYQFIPSLGLFTKFNTYSLNETGITSKNDQSWNFANTFEAGTDCVGFVKRSMSYRDKNPYLWTKMVDGSFLEPQGNGSNTIVPSQVQTTAAASERTYPIPERESTAAVTIVQRTVEIFQNNAPIPSLTAEPNIDELRRIVPGDIFVKDSDTLPETAMQDHIAIVAKIPDDPYGISDPVTYMSKIEIVEAEYSYKIQSVIRKFSLGDYDHNNLLTRKEFYPGVSLAANADGFTLKCQAWAIRRLK